MPKAEMLLLQPMSAKEAVDSVINMDGVIDVSSVEVKGGKIILSGGGNTDVNISGQMDASGTDGGSINVTGQNITVAETGQLDVSGGQGADKTGNGGEAILLADQTTLFQGSALARGGDNGGDGGFVEISGKESVGFHGHVDAGALNGRLGTLLIDPAFSIIHSGPIHNPLGLGYILSANAIGAALENADVIVQADDFIDVGTQASYNTGNAVLDFILNSLGDGEIDVSHSILNGNETNGNLVLSSDAVNFNRELTLGNGGLFVDGNSVNLQNVIKGLDGLGNEILLGNARMSTNAPEINVYLGALIQQGVDLAQAGATINVGDGDFAGDVLVDKAVTLAGAGATNTTTINLGWGGTGFTVTSSDVDISGFRFEAVAGGEVGTTGVLIDSTGGDLDNIKIGGDTGTTNNVFDGVETGVKTAGDNLKGLEVAGNTFDGVGEAIEFNGALSDAVIDIDNNVIDADGGDGIAFRAGVSDATVTINNNVIDATDDGVAFEAGVAGTSDVQITNNTIGDTASIGDNGVEINGVTDTASVTFGGSQVVTAAGNAVQINDLQSSTTVTFEEGTYQGDENGLLVDNTTTTSGETGRLVLNNTGALAFVGTSATAKGLSALTDSDGPGLDIDMQTSTASFEDGSVGLYLSGEGVNLLGDTIGETTFSDNADHFIELANDALFQPGAPTEIDASNATFEDATIGSVKGADLTPGGYTADEINDLAHIESKIHHHLDDTSLGLISVMTDGLALNSELGLQGIQRAVNVATAGDNVLLGSGVFSDPSDIEGALPIEINKSLTVLGAQHETAAHDSDRVAGSADETVLDFANATGHAGALSEAAIVITSDDVTIKGLDINADSTQEAGVLLRDTSVGGSLDNIDVSNNFIHGQSDDAIFGHGIETSNRFDSQDYTNVTASGNEIYDVLGDGIRAGKVSGLDILDNGFDAIGETAINVSDSSDVNILRNWIENTLLKGIFVSTSTATVVDSNMIDLTGDDAIEATDSLGIEITNNEIGTTGGADNIDGEGIDVNGSANAIITGNTVTETTSNGISVNPSNGSVIASNTITNVGTNGIYVLGSDNVTVGGANVSDGNTIDGAQTGIRVEDSDDVSVQNNDIDNTDGDGIVVGSDSDTASILNNIVTAAGGNGVSVSGGSDDATVDDNTISDVDGYGIVVEAGALSVSGNTIDTTGDDAVQVSDSEGVQIVENVIGTNGAEDNIGGEGIDVNNSDDANISGNTVEETVLNGISVNPSDNVVISGNTISNVGGDGINVLDGINAKIEDNTIDNASDDGIDVDGNDGVLIKKNTITNVGSDGIEIADLADGEVINNEITGAGSDGIDGDDLTNILIHKNKIWDVESDGIELDDVIGGTISGNKIRKDSEAFSADDEGIEVDDSFNIVILDNVVRGTFNDGIEASNVAGLMIMGNTVKNAGTEGIEVDSGSSDVFIMDNTVTGSGAEGIDVDGVLRLRVSGNVVEDSGEEGIEVTNTTDAKLISNDVTNSGTNGAFDGIFVHNTSDLLLFGNTVTGATDDGIHVSSSDGAAVLSKHGV